MVKFFKFILVLVAIGVIVIAYLDYKQSKQIEPTPVQQVTQDTNDLQNQIKDLENTVNTYKLKAQEDKLRKIRLQQLQNPEIITNELQKVNQLIISEGIVTYTDYIKEGNWFANKSLDISLAYNFGIVMDLNKISVRFSEETVILTIPKSEVKLKYVELDTENSKIDGEKSWLSKQFVPEDIKGIIDIAQEIVTEKLTNNKEVFNEALVNLKDNLRELVGKLGYQDVIFVEE